MEPGSHQRRPELRLRLEPCQVALDVAHGIPATSRVNPFPTTTRWITTSSRLAGSL
jgi:hypothetical protein